jgi:hypothetical protein
MLPPSASDCGKVTSQDAIAGYENPEFLGFANPETAAELLGTLLIQLIQY